MQFNWQHELLHYPRFLYFCNLLEIFLFQEGGTPLFVACQCNHLNVAKELVLRGAIVHATMKVRLNY